MSKIIAELLVDDRMAAYADIFTTAQANEVAELCASAPKLRTITDNLLLQWRSAAYVAGMPPQFVYGPKETLESYTTKSVGDTQLLALAGDMLTGLAQLVPEFVDEPVLRRKLLEAVVKRAAAFRDSWRPLDFPLEKTWREFLALRAFHFYVWSSERLSFQAVYNAYEDFFVECVRVANELPSCRTTDREFNKWVTDALGRQVLNDCWSSSTVERLRIIRISLAHASGRPIPLMAKRKVQVRMHDGAIQIFPGDVSDAIRELAAAAKLVIEAAVRLPQFT